MERERRFGIECSAIVTPAYDTIHEKHKGPVYFPGFINGTPQIAAALEREQPQISKPEKIKISVFFIKA
jgi:hypothetical protein